MKIKLEYKIPHLAVDYSRTTSKQKEMSELEGRLLLMLAFKEELDIAFETVESALERVYKVNHKTSILFEESFRELLSTKAIQAEEEIPKKDLLEMMCVTLNVNENLIKNFKNDNFYTLEKSKRTQQLLFKIPLIPLTGVKSSKVQSFKNIELLKDAKENDFDKEFLKRRQEIVTPEEKIMSEAEELLPMNKNVALVSEELNQKPIFGMFDEEFEYKITDNLDLIASNKKSDDLLELFIDNKVKIDFKKLIEEKFNKDIIINNEKQEGTLLNEQLLSEAREYNKSLSVDFTIIPSNNSYLKVFNKEVIIKINSEEVKVNLPFYTQIDEQYIVEHLKNNLSQANNIEQKLEILLKEDLIKNWTTSTKEQKEFILNNKADNISKQFLSEQPINVLKECLEDNKLKEVIEYDGKHKQLFILDIKQMPSWMEKETIYNIYFDTFEDIENIEFFSSWENLKNAKDLKEYINKQMTLEEKIDKSFMKDKLNKINNLIKLIKPITSNNFDIEIDKLRKEMQKLSDLSPKEVVSLATEARYAMESLVLKTESLDKIPYGKISEKITKSKVFSKKEKEQLLNAWKTHAPYMHFNPENDYSKSSISIMQKIIPLCEKIEKAFMKKQETKTSKDKNKGGK
ncbi:hypothetical protein [Mycoplasma todarodis]|uniref:hypothetical protein n=1 Tax=Mycoplasma todarodis TaxID=1937191 RepID=UPI003B33B362